MEESARKARNAERMTELNPRFALRVGAIISDLEAMGLRPRIQDAWRSPAEQMREYNSGFSKLKFGFHNITAANGDPDSLAVDLLDDDHPLGYGDIPYFLKLSSVARKHGCMTGILFGLVGRLVLAVRWAVDNAQWDAPVKIGWDPTHVQPNDVTVSEAKAGKRPA